MRGRGGVVVLWFVEMEMVRPTRGEGGGGRLWGWRWSKPVDHTDYRSMIRSLMYVTSSRPDIMFATCMCARYQANPSEHHVSAVKWIFFYLKRTINLGLWYPKYSGFDLTAYSDADHAGCHLDRKIESEYVAVSGCCAQVLWMRTQLTDYGFFYDKADMEELMDEHMDELMDEHMDEHDMVDQSPFTLYVEAITKAKITILMERTRFGMENCDTVPTPMVEHAKLKLDLVRKPVDHTDYRSMIGSLISCRMSLRLKKYICSVQFLGDKLACWSSKKQNCVSYSTAEFEYVAVSGCCAQVLWIRTQLTDYGFFYDKVPIYCDSKSVITISCNPVQHTRTKHIDVRYHFIKDHVEKGTIELYFVGTEYQLANLFTKSLPEARFKFLVEKLGMMSHET
nr:retrovirus-related Pol polyprotein from transposon TNT 1-94 [Tanacetum cinerariifolium]